MKIKNKPTMEFQLKHIPSGRAFTDRMEEGYRETALEDMHVSSKKEGGISQLAFVVKVMLTLGQSVTGYIEKPNGDKVEKLIGSPEAVRDQAYSFFLRNKKNLNLRNKCKVILQ